MKCQCSQMPYLPFFINILKAFDFPLPADAETVSQPVNACSPIRDLRKSCRLVPGGKALAIWSLTDLMFIILLLEPLPALMYAASNVLLWFSMRTRTSVSPAWIMHGPWTCLAWGSSACQLQFLSILISNTLPQGSQTAICYLTWM